MGCRKTGCGSARQAICVEAEDVTEEGGRLDVRQVHERGDLNEIGHARLLPKPQSPNREGRSGRGYPSADHGVVATSLPTPNPVTRPSSNNLTPMIYCCRRLILFKHPNKYRFKFGFIKGSMLLLSIQTHSLTSPSQAAMRGFCASINTK